jgi:hypothetical protein
MKQLSAALNTARSSLENVNRLLDEDERRHDSDLIEEPNFHEPSRDETKEREPEQESEAAPQLNLETTDERLEHSEFHSSQFSEPSPVPEERSMQPIKKVGLLCGREYSFPPAFIAKVNQLGKGLGVAAEFVKLGGTKMNELAEYSVIVDRISHEVEYYRGYLKHAVLQGTYVINNPFWWTADDKFFNYSVAAKLGIAIPKTVLLPQKGYPKDVDITSESLHNLKYPVDWDGLLDYVGRPAILKPFSGGGWKHVYKVSNREELFAAYDQTAPYCMTLQEFIDFEGYVRCFTFGKTDILPVRYDPKERRYLVEHNYLSKELGARIVDDARTINQALGYEMNTIEFAIKDGVPWAIDFLNPAPDFERDRITEFYFEHVVEQMAHLVIDRALNGDISNTWPRWEEMLGIGTSNGFVGSPRSASRGATATTAAAAPADQPGINAARPASAPASKPAAPPPSPKSSSAKNK